MSPLAGWSSSDIFFVIIVFISTMVLKLSKQGEVVPNEFLFCRYRAPEVLLQSPVYGTEVGNDTWRIPFFYTWYNILPYDTIVFECQICGQWALLWLNYLPFDLFFLARGS